MILSRAWRNSSPAGDRGTVATSAPSVFPAPSGGLSTTLVTAEQSAGTARVLRNLWPTLNGARLRGGCEKKALLEDGGGVVYTFSYASGDINKVFATTDKAIYDVTSPASLPDHTGALVSGLTSGLWSVFQHAMPERSCLIAVNGRDERLIYDGSAWKKNTPAIIFEEQDNMTSAQLFHGWLFKNRE